METSFGVTMALKIVFFVIGFGVGCLAGRVSKSSTSGIFGPRDPEQFVVGGKRAPDGAFPYMVALTQGVVVRSFMCGGSILTVRTVLTAAHCIDAFYDDDSLSSNLRGTVGTNVWNVGGQTYSFVGNATHQLHDEDLYKYDLGLLFTESSIILSDKVATVSLTYDQIGSGVLTRVAGWGRIGVGQPLSEYLLELETWTLGGEQCVKDVIQASITLNMTAPAVDPEQELCVFHGKGHGVCNHDSGSPLVRVEDRRLVGIVSWGFPCAIAAPDMFVRLSFFKDWLEKHMI